MNCFVVAEDENVLFVAVKKMVFLEAMMPPKVYRFSRSRKAPKLKTGVISF